MNPTCKASFGGFMLVFGGCISVAAVCVENLVGRFLGKDFGF